jgi:hypothetical protein
MNCSHQVQHTISFISLGQIPFSSLQYYATSKKARQVEKGGYKKGHKY